MQKYSIPVRFSLSDKILLEKQSKSLGLTLSGYIRNTVLQSLPQTSKTQSILS
jgi:hypothetical protein